MPILNASTGEILAEHVTVCNTFFTRGRGLMFRRPLETDEALLFVEPRESISGTAIHMFFVFFAISVIWLDANRRVVDARLARPFRPYYAPVSPARYFIEGHPELLDRVEPGQQIQFECVE